VVNRPDLRACFGPPLPGMPKRIAVPAPLFLMGAAIAVLVAAGATDSVWHTLWGQDETRWSYPHGLIGWGTYMASLAFCSCRLALRSVVPFGRFSAVGYALPVLVFSMPAILGPMALHISPEHNVALAATPGFAGAGTQRMMEVVFYWGLDRTNPLFLAMAASYAVAATAMLRMLDPRPWRMLEAALAGTTLYMAVHIGWAATNGLLWSFRTWAPLPVLPGLAAWAAARRAGLSAPSAWAATGLASSLTAAAVYLPSATGFSMALAGAPVGWAVGRLADRLSLELETPGPRAMPVVALLMGAALPAVLGTVDLVLRMGTP